MYPTFVSFCTSFGLKTMICLLFSSFFLKSRLKSPNFTRQAPHRLALQQVNMFSSDKSFVYAYIALSPKNPSYPNTEHPTSLSSLHLTILQTDFVSIYPLQKSSAKSPPYFKTVPSILSATPLLNLSNTISPL